MRQGSKHSLNRTPANPVDAQLNELMQKGYDHVLDNQEARGCDLWLEAWELIMRTATPEMRSVDAFDAAHPQLEQSVFNWTSDLDTSLHNAGLTEPIYHEHRLRVAREQLARFPEMNDLCRLNLGRAEGESLWALGRRAEAEATYRSLIAEMPDQGWAYIGWSDHYHWEIEGAVDHGRVESILQQALARPNLVDRSDALDRLVDLYTAMDRPEKADQTYHELELQLEREKQSRLPFQTAVSPPRGPVTGLGRNDRCWCGSGKKYKHCHLRADSKRPKGR